MSSVSSWAWVLVASGALLANLAQATIEGIEADLVDALARFPDRVEEPAVTVECQSMTIEVGYSTLTAGAAPTHVSLEVVRVEGDDLVQVATSSLVPIPVRNTIKRTGRIDRAIPAADPGRGAP